MNRMSEKYRNQVFVSAMTLIHILSTIAIFCIFWMLFRYGTLSGKQDTGFRYNYFVTIAYSVCLMFFNRTYNAYLLGYTRIRMLVFAQFLAQLFSVIIIYTAVSLAWNNWMSPVWFLFMMMADILLDMAWSFGANGLFFRLNPEKKTILIYRNMQDKIRFGSIKGKPTERMYKITRELMYDGSFRELKKELEGYDAVFVAGVNSKCRNGILKYCKEKGISGFFLPHIGDVIMQEAAHVQAFDSPVMYVTRSMPKPEYRLMKRVFDILISLAGLAVLSPVMIVIAILIRCYDGEPALYKQTRMTRNGKRFRILKFRSMREDAEKDGQARLSSGNKSDDRITPIGRVIREYRLDELPQLFNILKGDMSFVGPRPERPEIAEAIYRSIPDFRLRLQVKAGLTGYAQVYGKYNIDPYEKLQFDLLYINNMSMLTDLKLLFATAETVLIPEGKRKNG